MPSASRLPEPVVAATVLEAVEPIALAVGGFGAVGAVLGYAYELRKDDPQWSRAAAVGSVWGGVAGTALLTADMLSRLLGSP